MFVKQLLRASFGWSTEQKGWQAKAKATTQSPADLPGVQTPYSLCPWELSFLIYPTVIIVPSALPVSCLSYETVTM